MRYPTDQRTQLVIEVLCRTSKKVMVKQTRPDTRQDSRGRLGWGRNATWSLDLSRVRWHFQKSQADRQMNRPKHLNIKRSLN